MNKAGGLSIENKLGEKPVKSVKKRQDRSLKWITHASYLERALVTLKVSEWSLLFESRKRHVR